MDCRCHDSVRSNTAKNKKIVRPPIKTAATARTEYKARTGPAFLVTMPATAKVLYCDQVSLHTARPFVIAADYGRAARRGNGTDYRRPLALSLPLRDSQGPRPRERRETPDSFLPPAGPDFCCV